MAQHTKDNDRETAEDEEETSSESEGSAEPRGGGELVRADASDGDDGEGNETDADGEEEVEEEGSAANLGSARYVLSGFFAAGMLGAYVLGRALQAIWTAASNKDWFSQSLPRMAAVSDDDKGMYSLLIGGLVALVMVYRTYQKPEVRTWADEVAAELQKVVWPSRKDVTNSTIIVIVASTVATVYLTLLDRLWAFVTNIVYGDGS
ncbi:Preprotein translocase subunit SecE [Minicystis rosea]|nr:Preprotein translocase subunit SecE [Minicystis rosea]